MKTPEIIVSLLLILISLLFCFFSLKLGIGRINDPGPGFIPFLTGSVLILLSLCTMLFEGRRSRKAGSKPNLFKRSGLGLAPSLLVLISLVIYVLVLDLLGFGTSTFLFLTFLFTISENRSWKVALGASIITTASAYFVFIYLLEIGLPKGTFGF
jgi:putative tricarboxylic transport membrane protein